MTNNLLSSPFIRKPLRTQTLMFWVMVCLLPGFIAQSYYFGIGTLVQVLLASSAALATETATQLLRGRSPAAALADNSALVTGVLLGLALPAYAPWWAAVIGGVFAIAVVKQLYGGLGNNLFNPAMAAYVLLLVSFPVTMTSWIPPKSLLAESLSVSDGLRLIFTGFTSDGFSLLQIATVDGHTLATPLDAVKTGLSQGLMTSEVLQGVQFGAIAGHGWQVINLAYLLGGCALLYLKVIRWHLPVAFLVSLIVLAIWGQLFGLTNAAPVSLHLLSGATMLGAFFIITDPVSAATSPRGRMIFAALIALFVYVIRSWGGYPDAVAFSVLLANMCVPMIDHFTKTRVYGYNVEHDDD